MDSLLNLTCPRSGGRVLLADDRANTNQVYAYCEHLSACGAEWSEDGAEIRTPEPEVVEVRLCAMCFHRHEAAVYCAKVMLITNGFEPFTQYCGCIA